MSGLDNEVRMSLGALRLLVETVWEVARRSGSAAPAVQQREAEVPPEPQSGRCEMDSIPEATPGPMSGGSTAGEDRLPREGVAAPRLAAPRNLRGEMVQYLDRRTGQARVAQVVTRIRGTRWLVWGDSREVLDESEFALLSAGSRHDVGE